MAIDKTKKIKNVTVDGALMPFSSAIDTNIQPENIKKDVTILGVTGTLEGGGGTNKLVQVVSGQEFEITADDLAGITSIRAYAFYNSNITSISFPSSLLSFGDYAFHDCTNLTGHIEIPKGVTQTTQDLFSNTKITSIYLPEGFSSIKDNSLRSTQLTRLVTPSTLKYMGQWSTYLSPITEFYMKATNPMYINGFPTTLTKIYVPVGSLSAYQTATNWSEKASIMEEMAVEDMPAY